MQQKALFFSLCRLWPLCRLCITSEYFAKQISFLETNRKHRITHFGTGILAMAALARAYDYTLVYGEQNGVNIFFIQTSILKKLGVLHKVPSLEKLQVSVPINGWEHRPETDKTRSWIWNDTVWK
jgi:hypothetical protein